VFSLFPELLLFTSSVMANRLKFFFLISPCMLQINDAPVQIQAMVALQHRRPRSHWGMSHESLLLSHRDQGRTLHKRLQKIAAILTILTRSICHSTTQMMIKKQRSNTTLRGKPEPLSVNEFWKQLASSLERMNVDPLLRSPANAGPRLLFQIG